MSRRFIGVSRIDIDPVYIIDDQFYRYEYVHMDTETPYHYYPIKGSYVRMRFTKYEVGRKIATFFIPKINIITIPDNYEELKDE